MRIHMNPIRFAGELLTPPLRPGLQTLPVGVVFYAAGTDVGAALLEEATARPSAQLARRGPLHAGRVGRRSRVRDSREELLRLAGELASQGVAAFE